ncbi:hydroxyethylthiazole kinase [Syntrophus gentianae]|uniref:Hydroxyethylthiazole kinase n=1 Tax=Syntrophus gentianae TaxID=43775 RepID=A0A1H7VS02_9BACT|nr:hydroxyethylthiazole kinase [Syntrophus gentianae]SEM11577.1 hydroxyethylthiazole kinase [Syntrophus gentianae]
MSITPENTWASVSAIRDQAPLIHNITNYVVMNSTANALLALGASPVMAHAQEEVEDMVNIASALVINIGTLSAPWVEAMGSAARKAAGRGIPLVLDPVGAGATAYRTQTVRKLMDTVSPTIIRGNASEILALATSEKGETKGVDATESSQNAIEAAHWLNERYGSTVCISGETDFIVGDQVVIGIGNGHPLMTRVTGLGCTASALCGAFAAVNSSFPLAAAQAMAVMGIAGEMAAEISPGPGSLQLHFLDFLYRLTKDDLARRLRISAGAG